MSCSMPVEDKAGGGVLPSAPQQRSASKQWSKHCTTVAAESVAMAQATLPRLAMSWAELEGEVAAWEQEAWALRRAGVRAADRS